MKQRIAFLIGDPTGIGPEITAACLAGRDPRPDTEYLLVGDISSFRRAMDLTSSKLDFEQIEESQIGTVAGTFTFLDVPVEGDAPFGKVSAEAGAAVHAAIKMILSLIDRKLVDGFVFAPFNKEAMKLGGCPYSSELEMFKDHFNQHSVPGEINFADPMWTTRVTSHIAVKDIASFIKKDRIVESLRYLDQEMRRFGRDSRKIAVSALNPHGGEKGLFGREEIDEIEPAVAAARELGIDAHGPFPADTIFLRVRKGEYDAVVSMYHDQGQVATKLLGFDKGVTVHGSMPVAIATCAHGTAFDIAGTGKASPNALNEAVKLVESSLGA